MEKYMLNGTWLMQSGHDVTCEGKIPGSVYSFMLSAGKLEDPYYRDNELEALKLMERDFTFTRAFTVDADFLDAPSVILRCEGLDTICTVTVNNTEVGTASNMYRTWEYELINVLHAGENTISIHFSSPTRWIKDAYERDFIGGSSHAMRGFPHIRKAHCMFGWDWGPRLPDAGIWRDIYLIKADTARINDVHIRQRHDSGRVHISVDIWQSGNADCIISVTAPDNTVLPVSIDSIEKSNGFSRYAFEIENPLLWWPNGLGEQPLYAVRVELSENKKTVDCRTTRIGLRTMTVMREKDEQGESFAQCVNGISFFAMGADYIPEDNILSRVTPERTRKLLEDCVAANFNAIRVWGGGYYPDDFFFDICDELGLVVWQDFMFACANYHLTHEFEQNIRSEFIDNIKRIRSHPSLGLWCGNNEMEMFQAIGEYDGNHKTRSDYIRMFEHIIPEILREYDPDTFYWPASPSSGGGFDDPNAPNRGDVHYWDVWHGGKPFAEYRKFLFRYASEFGFQSFPEKKTVESFTLPQDRNIFSRVMEMHQRNEGANGKIMNYLSQTFLYPTSFDMLLYASQLLQAEAIRYGVEHWRRNRGICMGAIYWQLNDIWPVASWASIDYYGRWKALHYYAKRFFAPVMISCEEIGETTDRISVVIQPSDIETSARLCVANETAHSVNGLVRWALRDHKGAILKQEETPVSVTPFSSLWLDKIDFNCTDYLNHYMSFELEAGGVIVSSGTVLFTAPKHFRFLDPELTYTLDGNLLTVTAKNYAKSVYISSPDCDVILSDNFLDINADSVTLEILSGSPKTLQLCSLYDIGGLN